MTINRTIHYENALPPQIKSSRRYENRIGFWADVIEVDSRNNSVTVINDQQMKIDNIHVATKEWIVKQKKNDYAASERFLPPVGSRVFVLVPNGDISGAFVICSGYPMGETNTQGLWSGKNDSQSDVQKRNNLGERITQGGWNEKEYYENGNRSYTSSDKKIEFQINVVKDADNNIEKQVSLKAWDNSITITEDGYEFTDKNNNKYEFTEDGIKITDTNENIFELNKDGFSIKDSNKNSIKSSVSGLDFNGYMTIAPGVI